MATDREIISQRMVELKDALNDPKKFNGVVLTTPPLPLKGGNTRQVIFSATVTGNNIPLCIIYVTDNDGFKKGDVIKPDNKTIGFNLIQEKDIPIKVNLSCFTLSDGLKYPSNFRVGYNAAKVECDVAMTKVQGETDVLKEEIETLKKTLSGIHTLSAPPNE
jgi:hypothetical protein